MKELTVQTVADWLNALAPFDSAEDFDNVGLLLGDPAANVRKLLFALDVTPALVREAAVTGADLIVTHHPLLFSPLRRIDYTSPQGQALAALAGSRIHVIAAHTNWDKAPGGVSDALAEALALKDPQRGDDYLRMGALPRPMTPEECKDHISRRLNAPVLQYGDTDRPITAVAVAGGAYGEGAVCACLLGAQAYVTGEIKHHELMDACARGLVVYQAGHYATEAPGIAALYQRFLSDAAAAAWPAEARLFDTAPYAGATLSGGR